MTDEKELTDRQKAEILLKAILLKKWPKASAEALGEIEAGHHGEALFAIRKLLNEKPENNCFAKLTQTGDDGFRYYSDRMEWCKKPLDPIKLEAEVEYLPVLPCKKSGCYGYYVQQPSGEYLYYYLDELDHLLTHLVFMVMPLEGTWPTSRELNLKVTLIEALRPNTLPMGKFFGINKKGKLSNVPNDKLISKAKDILEEHQAEEGL